MPRYRIPSLLTVLTLVLAGCVGSADIPQTHFYRLPDLHPTTTPDRPLLTRSLEVPRLQATGLLHERAMLHSDAARPIDLQRYPYHQWQDPPGLLLRDHLVDYLRRAGVAERILPSTTGIRSELRLLGRVIRFERVLQGERVRVAVELDFTLLHDRGIEFGPRRYRATAEARNRTLAATIEAFGVALQPIYDGLIRDLGQPSRDLGQPSRDLGQPSRDLGQPS